jgi:DNA invertase Pin-like site-specific DNA recombinase
MSKLHGARCAIYARKSNENGLEQEFNSLDAQREACEAYVKSQAHEGWIALADCYDDGGFSGGSMERPALRRLLADIAAGRIDTVVVYKIDRLTRSLADFARMVDLFDRHEVTFVSVTQAFNTTSSMGRLTLNVLLSFAQFEREVTGERIRDKIAASKAKGLWMGGYPPLGFDAPESPTRILQVNDSEAATVRLIFERYLELRSVKLLIDWLEEQNIAPKQWTTSRGRNIGAPKFSRSAVHYLLRNPIYRGMIRHKSKIHPGGHAAIVDAELFERVQLQLDSAAQRLKRRHKSAAKAPLLGRIFDAAGRPMTPTSSHSQHKRVYRYYATNIGDRETTTAALPRVPGLAIEHQLRSILERLKPAHEGDCLDLVRRVEVRSSTIIVLVEASLGSGATLRLVAGEVAAVDLARPDWLRLELPLRIRNRRARTSIQLAREPETCFDQVLISGLRRAHAMTALDSRRLPMLPSAPATMYERRLVRLAFLAPDLQAAILDGRQPAHLSLEQLIERPIPIDWDEQRAIFELQGARSKPRHRSDALTLAAAADAAPHS